MGLVVAFMIAFVRSFFGSAGGKEGMNEHPTQVGSSVERRAGGLAARARIPENWGLGESG